MGPLQEILLQGLNLEPNSRLMTHLLTPSAPAAPTPTGPPPGPPEVTAHANDVDPGNRSRVRESPQTVRLGRGPEHETHQTPSRTDHPQAQNSRAAGRPRQDSRRRLPRHQGGAADLPDKGASRQVVSIPGFSTGCRWSTWHVSSHPVGCRCDPRMTHLGPGGQGVSQGSGKRCQGLDLPRSDGWPGYAAQLSYFRIWQITYSLFVHLGW